MASRFVLPSVRWMTYLSNQVAKPWGFLGITVNVRGRNHLDEEMIIPFHLVRSVIKRSP